MVLRLFRGLCVLVPLILLGAEGEPDIVSIFPAGGRQGTGFEVEVRGTALEGAHAVWSAVPGISAQVVKVEPIELPAAKEPEAKGKKTQPGQRVVMRLEIDAAARVGVHSLRLLSARGVSNPVSLRVSPEPMVAESQAPHGSPELAQPLSVPVVVNGKISEPGEVDYYSFSAAKDQELTFEVWGRDKLDPQVTLYAGGGSWFDPQRAVRLAFSDDTGSEFVDKNPRLTYRFPQSGRYFVEVGSFLGNSAPDPSYQLRIFPGGVSTQSEPDPTLLSERSFTRKLERDRLVFLWSRTVQAATSETAPRRAESSGELTPLPVRASNARGTQSTAIPEPVQEKEPNPTLANALELPIPALVEGAIERPGDVDTFKLKVKSGDALAFEMETPDVTLPAFNPRLDVLDADGREVLTNIYKRIARNFTFYLKTVEPKTIYTFEREGDYYLQIHDVTSRLGAPGFKYRLLIRPQVPHAGEIEVKEDRLNLRPGAAEKLTVSTAQEEGFAGEIAITVEGLPPGVQAVPATQVEPVKGPPLDEGAKERFVPKKQQAIILLVADADAPTTKSPSVVRVSARPVVQGHPGAVLKAREIPVMVVRP